MTSFLAVAHYSPIAVLIVGLLTSLAFWGTGAAILRALGLALPPPWTCVAAPLLGIQTISLSVQVVGMAAAASGAVLIGIWGGSVALGAAMLLVTLRDVRPFALANAFPRQDRASILLAAIVAVALVVNLLIAIAPSSKIDELYYHMLVPGRIVGDGALRFYQQPWEAAIWPQMIFQIAAAPLHALGYPDAMNVVSWSLFATLIWLCGRVAAATKLLSWGLLWAASLCVGIYPAVWELTGGAHAMGDLAMAAAIVAFCGRQRLLAGLSAVSYGALLSILLLAAATSKVSLLPLCAAVLGLAAYRLLRSSPSIMAAMKLVAVLAMPWLVFFCPIALWCWGQSGSPFGPVFAGALGPSVYPPDWSSQTFHAVRVANTLPLAASVEITAVDYSPLVWLGVIGAFVSVGLPIATRAILAALFVAQCVLIYVLLPHEARFLGGLHYGLVIVFAAFAASRFRARLASAGAVIGLAAAFVLPWLAVQLYYAGQFLPVSLGIEKVAFYESKIALYADYVKLDRILAADAVILVQGFRLASVYAPRPVFFDEADLPAEQPAVLLAPPRASRVPLRHYARGEVVYADDQAVLVTHRTPGRKPLIGPLEVTRLIKSP